MVLIYWVMALPYRLGIGSAWCAGLLLDILEGSALGLNAISLVILAYVTLSLHQRMRMFTSLQQSGLIFALVGLNLMLCHWPHIDKRCFHTRHHPDYLAHEDIPDMTTVIMALDKNFLEQAIFDESNPGLHGADVD